MNYSNIISPVGTYLISSSAVGINYIGRDLAEYNVRNVSTSPDTVINQLKKYFNGHLDRFNIEFDLQGTEFQKKVWQALLNVPYGQTRTYQWVANQIGRPSAVRAVANAIGKNPISIVIPCHRIIGANGKLTGYAGGLATKAWLLGHEEKYSKTIV